VVFARTRGLPSAPRNSTWRSKRAPLGASPTQVRPVTVSPGDGLDAAMELMARHKVRRLPVVEGGRLVGVVSQADIALGAKEAKTGAVVEQISQPTSVARER